MQNVLRHSHDLRSDPPGSPAPYGHDGVADHIPNAADYIPATIF